MSDISTKLLLQLKDYSSCNDDLAVRIRKTVLEPFQLDLSKPDAIKKPPPTPTRFKQMATQLAPVAMRIVNQNIEGLLDLKRATTPGNYTIAVNCLIDTSFYALTALRHMNTFTSLKPLDIEKTTSNLICKMVELGEYNRALDEICKFRSLLSSVAKVQLTDSKSPIHKQSTSPRLTTTTSKGVLTETHHNYQPATKQSFSPVPDSIVTNQWEEDMLNKYQDLFQFPLDTTINDRTMILLVLAYQMNAMRCWCEIGEGALAKYVPYFMEKSGNFIDWCQHLLKVDSTTAKKQLDAFQRLLYKAANRYPLTVEDSAYHCYNLQTVALNTVSISGTHSLKVVMDRMVRIGITYEKATSQTLYAQVQKRCHDFLEHLNPNINDLNEMDSYFVLCEYYAYVSRKAKSYQGAFYAYKHMIRPLIDVIQSPSTCTYYHAAYAANAKLALGSVQMDKMVLDDTFADINKTLNETISCLRIVSASLENSPTQDEHSEQALVNLCKSIDVFRQSSKRLYEFVSDKIKQALIESKNNPMKTPPRMGEIATPSDFGQWNSNLSQLNATLQQCSETLPASLSFAKKKSISTGKRTTSQTDIMISFIEIMVLLARMNFNINDETTYQQAYEYLSTAEQMCAQVKFSAGYRMLSGSYYNLGATMIKTELFTNAVYPFRKSCSLLEKDTDRVSTDEGKLQLCKRYEILGTCCQKNKHFEEAIKAYRLALKRVPVSAIERFVNKADTTAVSTIIESDPLVPKLIDRFLRASIIDANQSEIHFASEFMDMSTLNQIQQCVIYECELKMWNVLALKMNLSKFQSFIVDKLLQIYDGQQYPIRRTRVLLSQVRLERSKISTDKDKYTRKAMDCAKEALALLKSQEYAQDSNLLNYRRHYLALASSWIAICGRELNEEVINTFSTTLQQWGILLKKITPIYNSGGSSKADIQQVYDSIDDVDQFYDHIRMLADLFGVTGQHVFQINTLRLMLKLNNGLRDVNVDHVSESIILSSTIGKIYCDMGYTGKASVEFSHAKNAISNRPCNNTSELVYCINYSNYLACIGDCETSKEVFDATKFTWQHTPPMDSKNALFTAKAYTARCMLLADVYSTKSLLLSKTDTLDSAIICSTNALQLLNKCIQVVQKQNEERTEKKKKRKSFELENPFMPTPSSKEEQEEEAQKVVFRESQWIMAQKVSECLVTLASLYMKKGSWNEAKYFVKQGPQLAEKVNSNAIFYNSYLCASEFHLRCGDLALSQDSLESAILYQPGGQLHVKDTVRLKMAMADLAAANEYYNEAITTYDEANNMLQNLSHTTYISALEQFVDIKEDVSRDIKVMFEDEVEKSDKYECIPLQQMQNANIIEKAFALSDKGEVKTGIVLLEQLEESGIIIQNDVELNAALANLRMSLLHKEISARSDAHLLLYESMALPAMKILAGRGGIVKKNTMDQELRVIQDHLTNVLERMLDAHSAVYDKGRPCIIQGLCNESGFAMFLKNQTTSNSRVLNNNFALLSSYYLEMAKGITMRREMQSCLKIKMKKQLVGQSPSTTEWPLSEEEQEAQADAKVNMNPKWLQAHLNTLSDLYREEHELEDGEFQEKFIDILPTNWTVCSLTLDPVNQDLYAVQMRKKESPFVVKIPLNRSSHRFSHHTVISYNDAVAELRNIIKLSDDTIHNSSQYNEPNEVDAWWAARKDLDNRIKKLLDSIENQWFSGFKGLLSGRTYEYKEELAKFQKALNETVFKMINAITYTKKQVELSLNFCRMVLRLGRYPTFRDLEDIAYFALSCYEAQEIQIDYSKLDVKKMTDQMKVLITRYHDKSSIAGVDTIKNIPNDHVILIMDKYLQMFPMESTPMLRPQSVSRLPCLSFLRDRILFSQAYDSRAAYEDFGINSSGTYKDFSVSRKSAFYVLNPGGDLKDTQKELEPLLKSMPEWDGVTGSMPIEFQCKDALQSRDIYMYFGHSGGQAFMRGTTVRQLPTCAVSLLMGCSSGVLEANGEFDPYGYVLNYLLAGSPAVVANLWDVTDRSIDRLTKHMLYSWGLLKKNNTVHSGKSIVQAVTESRTQCKLSYLIGAAPVVYGIPVYLDN